MLLVGMIAAFLAAALHVFIFYIESFARPVRLQYGPRIRGGHQGNAFNQGFYNFFLAIEAFAGVAVYYLASHPVGLTLALFGVGSMFAAAVLLFITSLDKRSAAIKQGFLPLLAVVTLAAGALL